MNAYEIITKKIIEILETGTIPWQKPWKVGFEQPINGLTGRKYHGINSMILNSLNFEYPIFLTFNQVKELGGFVKKGEKSCPIVFWSQFEVESKKDELETETRFFLKHFSVFNIAQCENLELPKNIQAIILESEVKSNEIDSKKIHALETSVASKIINSYLSATKMELKHAGKQAFYSPVTDQITLPKKNNFLSNETYFATLFHEMAHSTGHKNRLDRFSGKNQFNFGSHSYSKEELVAEMASAFLCQKSGIRGTINNSASYIASWLKVLKNDQRMIIEASSKAQKACELILGEENE